MTEEYAEFKNTNCYYSTAESNVNVSNFSQSPNYINFEDIFDMVQSECKKFLKILTQYHLMTVK